MAISNSNYPQLPNLTVAIVNGKYSYLWPYTTKIVNGRIIRTKGKKSVGSIQGGGQTGLVVWKDEFLAQNPELRAYDVYRKSAPRGHNAALDEYQFVFVAKSDPHNYINSKKELLQAGGTWFLDQLLANTPLIRALNRTFYKDQTSSKLLSLAYFVLMSRSLDFNHYINCVGSTRLPYPSALTERDINLFLKEISDVQLAHFFDELQRRYLEDHSLNRRFYVIEHQYPNNIINHMIDDNLAIHCSNSTLQNAIKKELQQNHWHSSKVKKQLLSFSLNLDDRIFTIVNEESGMPLFANCYQSKNFKLDELISFCKHNALLEINKRDFANYQDAISQEYAQAFTGGFDDIKASVAPDLMSYLGSNSENGQIFAINKFPNKNLSANNVANNNFNDTDNEKNEPEEILSSSATVDAFASKLRNPLTKKLNSSHNTSSNTVFSSNRAFSAPLLEPKLEYKAPLVKPIDSTEPNLNSNRQDEVILLSECQNKLINQLTTLLRNKQSFVLMLPSNHSYVDSWENYFIDQLLSMDHYDEVEQCFKMSTNISFTYTDHSAANIIKGRSGNLLSIPKKRRQNLFLHIKLNLQELYKQTKIFEEQLQDLDTDNSYEQNHYDLNKSLRFATKEHQYTVNQNLSEQIALIKEHLNNKHDLNNKTIPRLKALIKTLCSLNHHALAIVLSNCTPNDNQAFHAYELLTGQERFFDYMCWDVFKLERISFDPFTYKMRPEVSQLFRAKNFILFIASSLYKLIQCAILKQDHLYDSSKIRNNLGFSNPDEYLQALNSIIAERKKEGLIYNDISIQQHSLLNYLNLSPPSQEHFSNVKSDSQVALQNYNSSRFYE